MIERQGQCHRHSAECLVASVVNLNLNNLDEQVQPDYQTESWVRASAALLAARRLPWPDLEPRLMMRHYRKQQLGLGVWRRRSYGRSRSSECRTSAWRKRELCAKLNRVAACYTPGLVVCTLLAITIIEYWPIFLSATHHSIAKQEYKNAR